MKIELKQNYEEIAFHEVPKGGVIIKESIVFIKIPEIWADDSGELKYNVFEPNGRSELYYIEDNEIVKYYPNSKLVIQ